MTSVAHIRAQTRMFVVVCHACIHGNTLEHELVPSADVKRSSFIRFLQQLAGSCQGEDEQAVIQSEHRMQEYSL